MSQMPPPTVPPTTPPPPGGGAYTPPPPPPPAGGGSAGGSDRQLMVVLSYLWILALIPLLTKKDDREVQWHAKNGLAILVAEVAAYILFMVLSMALGDMLGCGLSVVSCVLSIAFLVIRVICIVKGINGQRYRVPFISDFADKM